MSLKAKIFIFSDVWEEVSEGIEHIYQLKPMTTESWMKFFTLIYNYCTSPNHLSTNIYSNKLSSKRFRTNQPCEGNILGEDLYLNIKNYLIDHLQKNFLTGEHLQGDDLLRFYVHHWSKYVFPSKVLHGFCSYLNSYYIRRTIDAQIKDIYEIFPLTMKIWENVFFDTFHKQVTQACLNLIKTERNHIVINTNLISQIIQSYVALGCAQTSSNDVDKTTSSLIIYKDFFEKQFLQDTEQFYLLEAVTFLNDNSVSEYLKRIEQRLQEEEHRVQSYLHPSTLQSLIKTLENVLIQDRIDIIFTEAKVLLHDDRQQDLIRLHKLISRVPNAFIHLKDLVETHIYQVGLDAIERLNEAETNNPKIYVETILDVHRKFVKLIEGVFNNKPEFLLALDQACVKFINKNTATKSPELLARYCDILLRKGNKGVDERELEEKFNGIMAVFDYMDDKDVFEKFYRNRLAKRLVGELSASDDSEELMISKLKQKCGHEYTVKLQKMFQDTTLSKTTSQQYRTYCEQRQLNSIDFSVMVITYNSWPFSAGPNLILPIEIKRTMDSFTNFYSQQHSGRKLMWLYQHSRGELQTLFTKSKHILQVSTYQMNVLLLFNKQTQWTVEQIQDETQIQQEILLQVLCILLKIQLLICDQVVVNDDLKESDIQSNYQMKLSDQFKHKNTRINLNVPIKSIEQKDNEGVQRTIDEDRKLLIQAAIVRTMKARQTLKHALLMQEVIQQLSSRFKPQIPLIKKCIDMLIEKEYLERHATEKDILRYLA